MNREVNAIRISALTIVGFGFITLFENGFFVPLIPGIDIAIVILSFLFGFWNWKMEKTLSIGSFLFGIGFLGASLPVWEIIFSIERLSAINETLLFDYLLIAKAIFILVFGVLCAVYCKKSILKLCYLLGGIGACTSLLFSEGSEWFLVAFSGLCALPSLLSWNQLKVPLLWVAFFIFQLISAITSQFMG